MSESIGLIAARAPFGSFKDAVFHAWPRWGRVGEPRRLPDWDAFSAYSEEERGPHEVIGFYQDGSWSVLAESSPTRMDDDANLCSLSKHVGAIVCLWIETHGGCAAWQYYEDGALVREVAAMDAPVTQKGTPRPEESGVGFESFFTDEAWQVWSAFGLKSPYEARDILGVTFDDHEAMEALAPTPSRSHQPDDKVDGDPAALLSTEKKPWWRFW